MLGKHITIDAKYLERYDDMEEARKDTMISCIMFFGSHWAYIGRPVTINSIRLVEPEPGA